MADPVALVIVGAVWALCALGAVHAVRLILRGLRQ